jgi:hypothetical protein
MGESTSDRQDGPKRTFPPFDPIAGMRAVADVQAEGLRAAGDLLERVLGSEPEGPGPRSRPPAVDYNALVDAWTDLLRRTFAGVTRPGQPDVITVAVDANGVGPQVSLALSGPANGTGAVTEVWLHNGTLGPVGPLALHCGQLTDPDGTRLAARVSFEPGEIKLLPARSSRAVAVSVVATRAPRPGTYRGTIQASGAPGLWLPFEVCVEPC